MGFSFKSFVKATTGIGGGGGSSFVPTPEQVINPPTSPKEVEQTLRPSNVEQQTRQAVKELPGYDIGKEIESETRQAVKEYDPLYQISKDVEVFTRQGIKKYDPLYKWGKELEGEVRPYYAVISSVVLSVVLNVVLPGGGGLLLMVVNELIKSAAQTGLEAAWEDKYTHDYHEALDAFKAEQAQASTLQSVSESGRINSLDMENLVMGNSFFSDLFSDFGTSSYIGPTGVVLEGPPAPDATTEPSSFLLPAIVLFFLMM